MADWKSELIDIKGITVRYHRTGGNKPPLVLLHGVTDSGLCWTPVAEVLAERFDVTMVDAQGHGLSDRVDADFRMADMLDHLAGVIEKLDLKRPVLMGHSMGASVVAGTAARNPDLARAVVLEDPGWQMKKSNPSKEDEEKQKRVRTERTQLFLAWIDELQTMSREEIAIRGRIENPGWSEAELGPWAESKLQFDPAVFGSGLFDFASYEENVPGIRCPILLITADPELGGIVTPELARQIDSLRQPNRLSAWVQIEDAGHSIRRDQFAIYMETVNGFLEKVNRDG
ncbi:MAG: alpha/beta hydrolase [Proteobacteria bacterium]|nr:alpha/beta hydrolase [Pseudomonadota bacterium]